MRFILLFALLLLGTVAQAQSIEGPKSRRIVYRTAAGSRNLLNGVALNASASARTVILPTRGYDKVSLFVQLSRSTATDVQLSCRASGDEGSNYGYIQSTSITSGSGTLSDYTDIKAVTGNKNFVIDYGTATYDYVKCTFSGTGAGASDLITVQAVAGTT